MKQITFSTKSDYKSYMKLAYSSPSRYNILNRLYMVCVALIILQLYHSANIESISIVSVAFLGILVIGFLSRRNVYRSSPNIGREIFWIIDENGIDKKTDSSYFLHMGWEMITKFSENRTYFFIWFNNAEYTYFPKNVISEQELAEVKKLFFLNGKKGL